MHRVIVLEKNKISLIDSKDNTTKWSIEDKNKMVSTYRLDNYIFLYTFNGWTKMYTSLINIDTGEFYWRDKELNAASNCIAKDNKLFYVDKSFNIVVMEIESGNMIMEEKYTYKKWYSSVYPQLVVYGDRVIAFTKKNAVRIDLNSKKLVDYNFRNLDLKDVLSMSDRYNITVNRYTSSGSGGDTFMYGVYAADAGGYGGGDAGGGGGGDGGGG